MFGLSKRERRQKRYAQIRTIARRQGRVTFDLTDLYLDQLAFNVLDLIIAVGNITDEQYTEMGIPDSLLTEYDAPTETTDALDANAAKAAAFDEYTRVFDEGRSEPSVAPEPSTSIPEPEPTSLNPVRETTRHSPEPSYSSDDDSSRRSSGSGSSLGSSGWGDDSSSSSSSSSSDSGGGSDD